MQQRVQCKIGQKIFAWAIQTEGVFLVALQNKALINGRNIVDDDLWCVVGQEAGQLKFFQISYGSVNQFTVDGDDVCQCFFWNFAVADIILQGPEHVHEVQVVFSKFAQLHGVNVYYVTG